MPNQPKTPVRSFRLPDETTAQLRRISETMGTTLTGAVVQAAAASTALGDLLRAGPMSPEDAAFKAADEASWLDVKMPRDEADRRLTAALDAARPYIAAEERARTLRDVVGRLEGFGVDPAVVEHFRGLVEVRHA